MDMTSNLKVLDLCTEILQRFIPISDDTEEARLLHKIMDELTSDIRYIHSTLKVVRGNIGKLQNEVVLVVSRHYAELTKRRRSNLKSICRAAILS